MGCRARPGSARSTVKYERAAALPACSSTSIATLAVMGAGARAGLQDEVGYRGCIVIASGVDGCSLCAGGEHHEADHPAHDGVDDQVGRRSGRQLAAVDCRLDDGAGATETRPDDAVHLLVELRWVLDRKSVV